MNADGFDADGFDAEALVADLTPAQLLAVQDAAERELASAALVSESERDLLNLLDAREATRCRGNGFDAALYVEISDRMAFRLDGFMSTDSLYAGGARLGSSEAHRRGVTALAIGELTSMTGEAMAPKYEATADAVARGLIGRDHVAIIAATMDRIPDAVSVEDWEKAELMLADAAIDLTPEATGIVGHRILAWLDPDGSLADDSDRQRQRGFSIAPQNRQLMSKVRALLSPELRARLQVVLEQWGALGMNNPDDPESPRGAADQPGLDPAVLAAAAERDERTTGQRQHDALLALCEWAQALAGQPAPARIPSQVVITVTDEDLARQAGIAWTATGTRLPISDLVKFAVDCVPYLAVFSKVSGQCLYLGRGSRFASNAQRLALFARDRGCTAPGCTVPFNRTQAHHMPDWADGGCTDIDHLGGACGRHNRNSGSGPGQWESTVLTAGPHAGRVGWRPAGRGGVFRVNPMFHPDKLGHRWSVNVDGSAEAADTGPPDEAFLDLAPEEDLPAEYRSPPPSAVDQAERHEGA